MNAKKQRDKNRRRANKLSRQAWDAAEAGRLDLAAKIIARAVELNPGNPVLWHDQGALLAQWREEDQAARCFENAIQAAPDFAEAYASLAAVRARQGQLQQAISLVSVAVRLAPEIERYQSALAAYEVLSAGGSGWHPGAASTAPTTLRDDGGARLPSEEFPDLAAGIERLDWLEIEARLTARGLAQLPRLLGPAACETLRTMFDRDRLFAKTVTMNKSHFGRGVYRYFAAPLPQLVEAIRRLVYPHVAPIANRWQLLLDRKESYPASWLEFRERCAAAGQATPSPLLLRYEAGGFNALHQDLRGEIFFPLQLLIVLSPRAEGETNPAGAFAGGEFLFCDQPQRKPADCCAVPAGLGDGVLFCTRERLIRVGGVYGLQPVKHGLSEVAAGIRYALGLPFHDFR